MDQLDRHLRDSFRCRSLGSSAMNGKFAKPGSKPSYAPDHSFDAEHILLELELDVPKKTVRGKCTTTFTAIIDGAREVRFDAVDLKIQSVALADGTKLRYKYADERCVVTLPRPAREQDRIGIVIEYRLVDPMAGVYFIGPDSAYPKKPVQIWTHGEAEESRYWFPCFDSPHDKATTEMIATVPRDFFALSNGALLDVREDKTRRTKTYHWKQAIPHSPYLVTLVAGKFSEIKDEWDGIPIQYYCEPGREDQVKRAFGKTPRMVAFFSEALGARYPYEKYAQIAVADFVMGGMEHTTATTQTDRVLMDAQAYPEFTADWLVSHELAHQWFGDLLTCKEWSHAWLNESFATYFEALFTEHDLGRDEFEYEMMDKLEQYLDEDKKVYRRAIVTNVYRKPDDLFDRHLYEKGSLVLHTLRGLLGDKLWWKAIGHYVRKHHGQAVETPDLVNAIQEATGRNMRKFFDQWVYSPGYPDYVADYWWDEKTKTASVRVSTRSGKGAFSSVPVTLSFVTRSGEKRYAETIEDKKHEFKYRMDSAPLDFRFDPDYRILKTAEVNKPYAMWVKQLESDPHCVGRLEAARRVAGLPTEESLRALFRAFNKEKFWGTAREIAVAIGRTGREEARRFLIDALQHKHPKARRGVAEALGNFTDDNTAARLKEQFRREKSYFVRAEILKSLSNQKSAEAMDWVKKAMKIPSWNDTIGASGLQALVKVPSREAMRLVESFSRYGATPSERGSAVQALARYGKSFPEAYDRLLELAEDKQVRIKHAAIQALGNLKLPKAVPVLKKISKDKRLPYRTQAAAEDALLKINPENDG